MEAGPQPRLLLGCECGLPRWSGGCFAFGAVLGVSVYGISQADVLIFGVVASTLAAVGAIAGGHFDDRIGGKPVIVASLSVLIVVCAAMAVHGPVAFWICGLCWHCSWGRRSRRAPCC